MPYLLVRQKFEDYKRWKPIFDEHGATRQENGGQGGTLYRNANDPDEAVILFEWDNLENARRYAQSEDLRDALQQAGVTDQADIYFLEEVEKCSGVTVQSSPQTPGLIARLSLSGNGSLPTRKALQSETSPLLALPIGGITMTEVQSSEDG